MPRRLVDLTMPIRDHFRWPVERTVKGDFDKGDLFQITRLGWAVHGFTHMDSPRHMVPGGPTTSDIPLDQTTGSAAVIDLVDISPEEAIDSERLATRAGHLGAGDIALFKTAWERQRSSDTPEFWKDAPYLTRDACEWLRLRRIKAAAFDFPQDYTIRLLLDGTVAPIHEHVSHDVLLRHGVILIEYLSNTSALDQERVEFVCLPMKIPDADGAPARVIAWLE